jgi:hypothetical protein
MSRAVDIEGVRDRLGLVASLAKPELTNPSRVVLVLELDPILPKSSTLTPASQLSLVAYPITQPPSIEACVVMIYSLEINVKFDSVDSAAIVWERLGWLTWCN